MASDTEESCLKFYLLGLLNLHYRVASSALEALASLHQETDGRLSNTLYF